MALFGLFRNSETLYFPGCFTGSFLKSKIENYTKILKRLKIDFRLYKEKEFVCCGGLLEQNGYEKQFRKNARENLEFLNKKGIKKIITNCPLCCSIFKNEYKNVMPDWNIETEFILVTIFNKLFENNSNNSIIKNYSNETVAYYDSCYLARHLKIYDAPRELLKLFGYQVIELPKNKEETLCCGSCGNFFHLNQEFSNKIAKDFIVMLQRRKIKKIITADPMAYWHLKENLEALSVNELQVIEFSDIICHALGIK